jgi:hypothetical protein
LRGLDGIAATAANSQQAQTAGIDSGVLGDEIGRCADVLDAILRLVGVAWCTAAAALICSVKGDGDVALLGQRQLLFRRGKLRKASQRQHLHVHASYVHVGQAFLLPVHALAGGVCIGNDLWTAVVGVAAVRYGAAPAGQEGGGLQGRGHGGFCGGRVEDVFFEADEFHAGGIRYHRIAGSGDGACLFSGAGERQADRAMATAVACSSDPAVFRLPAGSGGR